MTTDRLTYAVVTPARNEAANLRRLASCLRAQTLRPNEWIIVDDSSTDETLAIARAEAVPWVRAITSPAQTRAERIENGRRAGRDVIAFTAGLVALEAPVDVVVKLDCDVSFARHFLERLLAEFAADPALGIASGTAYEQEGGEWRQMHVTGSRVRGATRAYRWACLRDVEPLEERLGWDVIDELKARLLGWRTRSFEDLPFRHHRRVGARDGARAAWAGQGEVAYYCGYRPSYLVLRALHRARAEPAALALLWAFAACVVRRDPRYPDGAVRAHLREEQRFRKLPQRAREALGRR